MSRKRKTNTTRRHDPGRAEHLRSVQQSRDKFIEMIRERDGHVDLDVCEALFTRLYHAPTSPPEDDDDAAA